jgi:hypothetical protein
MPFVLDSSALQLSLQKGRKLVSAKNDFVFKSDLQ